MFFIAVSFQSKAIAKLVIRSNDVSEVSSYSAVITGPATCHDCAKDFTNVKP